MPGPLEDDGLVRDGVASFPSVLAAETDTTEEARECSFLFALLLTGFLGVGSWLGGAGPGRLKGGDHVRDAMVRLGHILTLLPLSSGLV